MFKIPQNQGFAIKVKLQMFDPSTNTAVPFEGEGAVISLIGQDYQISEAAYTQKGSELTVSDVRFWKAPAGEYTLAVSVPGDGETYSALFHQTVFIGDRTFRPMEWGVSNVMGTTVLLGAAAPAPAPAVIKLEGDLSYSGATAAGGDLTMTNSLKLTKDGTQVDGITFTYTSSQSWATVATDGKVTLSKNEASDARTATITAKCTYNGKTYSKTASIEQPGAVADVIKVEGNFSYASSGKVAAAGGSLEISSNTLKLTKNGTTVSGVTFTFASDQSYCTVDASTGKATFPAYTSTTADRKANITASCTYEGKTYKSSSVQLTQLKKANTDKIMWMTMAGADSAAPKTQAAFDACTGQKPFAVGSKSVSMDLTPDLGANNWLIIAIPSTWTLKNWDFIGGGITNTLVTNETPKSGVVPTPYKIENITVDGVVSSVWCYRYARLFTKADPAVMNIACE